MQTISETIVLHQFLVNTVLLAVAMSGRALLKQCGSHIGAVGINRSGLLLCSRHRATVFCYVKLSEYIFQFGSIFLHTTVCRQRNDCTNIITFQCYRNIGSTLLHIAVNQAICFIYDIGKLAVDLVGV